MGHHAPRERGVGQASDQANVVGRVAGRFTTVIGQVWRKTPTP
jgi:hypothetical protein